MEIKQIRPVVPMSKLKVKTHEQKKKKKAAARSKKQRLGPKNGHAIAPPAKKGKAESSSSYSSGHESDVDKAADLEVVDTSHTAKTVGGFNVQQQFIPVFQQDSDGGGDPRVRPKGPRGSTVFVDNLSCQVERSDVENFFKGAGEIISVRFVLDEYQLFDGSGYVEFATAEAGQEALKLNGQVLNGKAVSLSLDSGWSFDYFGYTYSRVGCGGSGVRAENEYFYDFDECRKEDEVCIQ